MVHEPNMPLRAEPVPYYAPAGAGRPGVLTAVGVISIVVACLSLLASCGGMFNLLWSGPMLRTQLARPATVAPPAYPPTPAGPVESPRGLNAIQRDLVIRGMTHGQLTPDRRKMLDKLLADSGQDILPFDPTSGLTPQKIAGIVDESGELPGVGGKRGNSWFLLSTGRIEVADDHAVFSPTRGERIRVAADDVNTPAATAQTSSSGATVTVVPAPIGVASVQKYFVVSGIGSLLNLILAGLLLTAGILVLMNSRRARRLHLVYASIKVPLALAMAMLGWLSAQEMLRTLQASGSPVPGIVVGSMAGVGFVVGLVFSLAYPVALLLVMRSPTVQAYYSSGRAG